MPRVADVDKLRLRDRVEELADSGLELKDIAATLFEETGRALGESQIRRALEGRALGPRRDLGGCSRSNHICRQCCTIGMFVFQVSDAVAQALGWQEPSHAPPPECAHLSCGRCGSGPLLSDALLREAFSDGERAAANRSA